MQDPCPKHSKPGHPSKHTWIQCYFMQDYRRLVEEKASGREDNLTTSCKHGRCQAHGPNRSLQGLHHSNQHWKKELTSHRLSPLNKKPTFVAADSRHLIKIRLSSQPALAT